MLKYLIAYESNNPLSLSLSLSLFVENICFQPVE